MTARHVPSSWSIRSRCRRMLHLARPSGLTVTRESARRLRVRGELDVLTAPSLGAALADPAVDEVDLSAITFIDASGLAVLVAAAQARHLTHLRLLDPAPAVVRILELCGEVDVFAVWT